MRIGAAFACAAIATAAHAQPASIDPAIAKIYFQELRQLGTADGGRMWGKMVSGPMMFVDASTRTIVANEGDLQGKLQSENGVWVGRLSNEMNPANTSVDFGGKRFSMVLWPLPDNKYGRRRLLMHESFHRIQKELGIPMADPPNVHLATADGRIWTRLEWRALTEALLHTSAARKEALSDAVTFRARRRLASSRAAEEERQLELSEGLAEYTGLALSGLPPSVLNDRAAVNLAQNESQESFVRSFAYSSGPAYALLLDATGAQWRKALNPRSDLSVLAARLYRIRAINPARADALVGRYTGARMIADERAREQRRLVNEARLGALFSDSLTVRLPMAGKLSFSFDPNAVTVLPGRGTVYRNSRISDAWGVFQIDSGEVLMERLADGRITGIIAALPVVTGNTVKGLGWTLTLAPGWSVVPGSGKAELTVAPKSKE